MLSSEESSRPALGDLGLLERQMLASSPSTWRRPLRILGPSYEDRLSKARDSRFSIAAAEGLLAGCVPACPKLEGYFIAAWITRYRIRGGSGQETR